MGTTPKPVRVLVLDQDLFDSAEVQDLIAKGHRVALGTMSPGYLSDYDLIVGRRAWYLDTHHLKYLALALKSARARINYQKEKTHA